MCCCHKGVKQMGDEKGACFEEEEQVNVQTDKSVEDQNAPETELEALRRELEEKSLLVQDYFNQLARAKADFENLRKRSRQEKQDLVEYGSEQMLILLLPVLDNFERALADNSEDLKSYKTGVEMIYNQLKEILEGEGLKVIPAQDREFDPRVHDAVMTEETEQVPDNTVMEELRVGYSYKDRVIRPAMVKVARRGC